MDGKQQTEDRQGAGGKFRETFKAGVTQKKPVRHVDKRGKSEVGKGGGSRERVRWWKRTKVGGTEKKNRQRGRCLSVENEKRSIKGRKTQRWTGGSRVEKRRGGLRKKGEGGGSAERISESASRRHFIMSPFTETFSFTL